MKILIVDTETPPLSHYRHTGPELRFWAETQFSRLPRYVFMHNEKPIDVNLHDVDAFVKSVEVAL